MAGVKGKSGIGSGGPGRNQGRKKNECQTCIYWTVDTPEQSAAANDPVGWWGKCSQLGIQTEADFCCKKFFRRAGLAKPAF